MVIGLFHRVSLHSDLPLHLAKFYSGKVTFQSVKLGLWINAGGNLHTVHFVDVRILPHLISQHFGRECAFGSVIPSQRNHTDHFDVAAILAQENKYTAAGGRKYSSGSSILSSSKFLFLPDQINIAAAHVIKS